jgi:hypothetical protein
MLMNITGQITSQAVGQNYQKQLTPGTCRLCYGSLHVKSTKLGQITSQGVGQNYQKQLHTGTVVYVTGHFISNQQSSQPHSL